MHAQAIYDQLVGRADRPSAMEPFDHAARAIARGAWPESVVADERPVVAVVCNLVPLELIHAAGALPVRLCAGAVGDVAASSPAVARDMCQVCRGALDRLASLRHSGRSPVAVVVPATCDWKTQTADLLGDGQLVRVLEIPRQKTIERARREWRRQVFDLADFLERRTGRPIDRRSLRRSIALYQRASWIGRRLAGSMKRDDLPIGGADLLLAFNLYYALPVERWIGAARALLEEVDRRSRPRNGTGARRPRLLLSGAPVIWPSWTLPLLIESAGADVVTDSLCSTYRGFSDLVSVDETTRAGMIEAVADRCLLPCTCPCFAQGEERFWRLENQARDFRSDGLLFHQLRNCYLFEMEAKAVEELAERLAMPFLRVECDYESPAVEALKTRIEAFVELLRGRLK